MTTLPIIMTLPAIDAFERRYRGDHAQEHGLLLDSRGHLIVERAGNEDSIEFAPYELEKACLGLLTHNHPRAKPPSSADLTLAARYGLTLRAYGITQDTGKAYDYTVRFKAPSVPVADAISAVFDNFLEQAERELAAGEVSDLEWERQARHSAVTRLARQFDFFYQRVERAIPISEMTRRERSRMGVLGAVETAIRSEVLRPLSSSLAQMLMRYSEQGRIPATALDQIRLEISALVQKTMLGRADHTGGLSPFMVRRGEVIPNSPYATTLWTLMKASATAAVQYHAAIMRKYLPEDLRRLFENAAINPVERRVAEMGDDDPGFSPIYLWKGPDGRKLSDRIWNAAGDMRRKLDDFLTDAIGAGMSADRIAQNIDAYLVDGVGSYPAMRLARTETAFAHARADSASAQGNPFVDTYSFFTAPSHKCCDVCDEVEAGSPYPKSDMMHLPPRHPECICGVIWNMVSNIKQTIIRLRQQIDQAIAGAKRSIADFIGPLSKRFLDVLFGTRGRS